MRLANVAGTVPIFPSSLPDVFFPSDVTFATVSIYSLIEREHDGIETAIVIIILILSANLLIDPAHAYWRDTDRSPVWVIRRRKLEKLRELQGITAVKTLFVGDSRSYNIDPVSAGFPSPAFNFASTTARAEDFLASWNIVCAGQESPPEYLVIGCTIPVFHPSAGLPLESEFSREYTRELIRLGAIKTGFLHKIALYIHFEHFRLSFKRITRYLTLKRGKKEKFLMREDGFATWIRDASPSGLERHLRSFPYSGLMIESFDSIRGVRKDWWEQLLDKASASNTKIVAYLLPGGHPDLLDKIYSLGGERLYRMTAEYVEETVGKHGGVFVNLHRPEDSGLSRDDFRDGIHLKDESQLKVAKRLEQNIEKSDKRG